MKYRSSKILDDFEFHDAEFTFEGFDFAIAAALFFKLFNA